MNWHNSPCALHHELHGKSADHQKRVSWRKHPQGNQHDSKRGTQNNAPTTSPLLREMTNHCSTADCAESVNDSRRRLLRHTVVTLFAENCLIHVLGRVCHCVKSCHQQNNVKKERPVASEHKKDLAPKLIHRVLLT